MGLAFFKMFLEIHIQNKGHIWKNKGCFWVTWTKISLKNYSMMPIVGLFLAILGFSNVNLRFLAHFHELQRKTSLRMTHKNIKSSLRTISFLEPLKSSYFFGQFKPWRSYKGCSYKGCSYKKKRVYLAAATIYAPSVLIHVAAAPIFAGWPES